VWSCNHKLQTRNQKPVSSHIEILRVLGLHGDAKGMGSAPAIHGEYVDSVFLFLDQTLDPSRDLAQLPSRKEAFVHGLLAPGAVPLEQVTHLSETCVIRDVIGNKIKGPAHHPPPAKFVLQIKDVLPENEYRGGWD
jgi:hypothetical protein